jgi:glycerol uptake facilitator-like aquaporin
VGIQLLENSLVTAFGLGVLILVLGSVSGAHFNPVVSLVDRILGRKSGTGVKGSVAPFMAAQIVGAMVGLAMAVYLRPVGVSAADRPRS